MNIEFLATVAVIAPDPIDSGNLYVEALGLPLGEDVVTRRHVAVEADPTVEPEEVEVDRAVAHVGDLDADDSSGHPRGQVDPRSVASI